MKIKYAIIALLVVVVIMAALVFYKKKPITPIVETEKETNKSGNANSGSANSGSNQGNQQSLFPLKVGSKGIAVKLVQHAFKLKTDGVFGEKTKAAVTNLYPNGEVTQAQFKELFIDRIALSKTLFPLSRGKKNTWVAVLNLILGNDVAESLFDIKTIVLVEKKINKNTITGEDLKEIIKKEFNL